MNLNLRNYRTTAYWASVLDVETFEPIGCMKVVFHLEESGPGRLAVVPETGFEVDHDTAGCDINGVRLVALGVALNAAAQVLANRLGKPVRQGSMTVACKGDPRNVVLGTDCTQLIREPAQEVAKVRLAEKTGKSLGRRGMYWLLQPEHTHFQPMKQPAPEPVQMALI